VAFAIIGSGLIGTSVRLAVQRAWPHLDIIALDRGDSLEPAYTADTVVLAAPVDGIVGVLRDHGRRFTGSLVTDVGSTKRSIVSAAREAGVQNFVGGHPMAGAASSGPGGARADLFDGKLWFLTANAAKPQALSRARALVEALGAVPVMIDADGREHDRTLAAVSHLPQLVASSLMKVAGEAAPSGLDWAGNGLRDTTRLAASSADMWESVLATNADEIRPLLLKMADDLRALAGRLDDGRAVRDLFSAANEHRRRLIAPAPEG
jgi:prephenate dehydrogenase